MDVSLFDYVLPKNLISQKPILPRDHCKLLVYDRKQRSIKHLKFYEIFDVLERDSVLVLNDTKVYPARLHGFKNSGGKIEVFLLGTDNNKFELGKLSNKWNILVNKKIKDGEEIKFYSGKSLLLIGKIKNLGLEKELQIEFNFKGVELMKRIFKLGEMPLPPYIKNYDKNKGEYYQTVYADNIGSCAAPTAGFHFTQNLMKKLKKRGIKIEYITLNVGVGTFMPIKVDKVEKHKMHKEYYMVSKKTADNLNKYRKEGRKIVAVGTTSVRTLESIFKSGKFKSGSGFTDIFIYPGYIFKSIDQFITNFHLPRSTPLMMVASFIGSRSETLRIYQEAIKKKYLFYSFGDSMLIL